MCNVFKIVEFLQVQQLFNKKTELALQFVSNCRTPSQRELYTKELRKFINLTVIGKCGIKGCNQTCEQKAVSFHVLCH